MKLMSALIFGYGVLAFTNCYSQEAPQKVKDTFSKMFPKARSVKWDKESETEWEAEFKLDGTEYSANFDSNGIWKETEHEINLSQVPETVKATLQKEFKDFDIEEIELSETSKGTLYEFDVEKGKTELEVAIDVNGKVVKKEMKTEEKHND